MGAGHSHALPSSGNERLLWTALGLTGGFLLAEVVGGVLTQSLALLSDAAHMFTDTAALAIALAAIRIARRPADARRSFGYQRFEILAAAFNAILLFLVAIYIVYEAYLRLANPPQIESTGMLVIAFLGLAVNVASVRLLAAGKDSSLNVKGAYLEVWSDMLGSLGVLIAALVIKYTGWTWVDSLVAAAIGVWVLPRTWVLLKESTNILLQGVPRGVELIEIEQALAAVPGVTQVHDLHVWALTSGRNVLSAHLVVDPSVADERQVMKAATSMIQQDFGIVDSTVQLEVGGEDLHANHQH